jgi:hypothetical protein
MSWEGEIFGVGMFEAMAEIQPEHADAATACATMEWFNIHRLEEFGHAAGVHVSLEQAEKLGCEGAKLVRTHSFEHVAKLTIEETPAADKMYEHLGKDAATPELRAFADDLVAHERTRCGTGSSPRWPESPTAPKRSSPISNVTGSQDKTR